MPEAIHLARTRLHTLRQERVTGDVSARARKETRRLQRWQSDSLARIERKRAAWAGRGVTVPRHVERRLADEIEAVNRIRENHDQLLKSLSVNPDSDPFIRLVAVFTGA